MTPPCFNIKHVNIKHKREPKGTHPQELTEGKAAMAFHKLHIEMNL